MNSSMLEGFVDELQKIGASAHLSKTSGILTNVGSWIARAPGAVGRNLASQPGKMLGAVRDLAHPQQMLRDGVRSLTHVKDGATGAWKLSPFNSVASAGGLYLDAKEVAPATDPMGQGRSRLERAGGAVGGQALGMVGMGRGMLPAVALGMGGRWAGSKAGKVIDKIRGYKPPQPEPIAPMQGV